MTINMKKHILILTTLCLALISCQKEDKTDINDGLTTFTATYTGATKTVLQGLTPMWTPSDEILVFDGEINLFKNSLAGPSATAEFKGKLAGQGRQHYLAVCPADADVTFYMLGKTVYGLEVPSVQTAVEGSYDPEALVSMAYTTGNTLEFKNLVSLIKFTVRDEGIRSVTVEANEDIPLAGNFFASYDNPIRINVEKGVNRVTLEGDFRKGATYYIVALPAVISSGFTVNLNNEYRAKDLRAPVDLQRSGMVDVGGLSFTPEDEPEMPDQPGTDNPGTGTDGQVIYLTAGPWDVDGAWFEVWSWPTGGEGSWYSVETVSTGLYKCTIPDTYSNVIFVRRGPDMVTGWDQGVHYWNKTDDLAIPSGMNHYTITGWGGAEGTWSTR